MGTWFGYATQEEVLLKCKLSLFVNSYSDFQARSSLKRTTYSFMADNISSKFCWISLKKIKRKINLVKRLEKSGKRNNIQITIWFIYCNPSKKWESGPEYVSLASIFWYLERNYKEALSKLFWKRYFLFWVKQKYLV